MRTSTNESQNRDVDEGNFGLFRLWMVGEAVGMHEITQLGVQRKSPAKEIEKKQPSW